MTFGRKFYEPLADGAPRPTSEINNDLETKLSLKKEEFKFI